jgi:hypothetical protein
MPSRRAHTVRLTAPTEALVHCGALLLEDALHTASLPEGSRLLLIRHLEVGQIRPRQSSATLSLTIEQQIRRLSPVPASDPAAATATAVYFEDALEPYILLCQQVALSQHPHAWFWQAAVPQWNLHQSAPETYRQILLHLAQQPQGAIAVAQLLDHLHQHRAAFPILSALQPQDAVTLLACQFSAQSTSISPTHATSSFVVAPAIIPLLPLLETWLPVWGAEDVRSHWLTLTILIHANSTRLLSADLPLQCQALIEQIAAFPSAHSPSASLSPGFSQNLPPASSLGFSSTSSPRILPTPSPNFPAQHSPPPAQQFCIPAPHFPARPSLSDWCFTPYSGFFFTVPLLERLRLPQFLCANPSLIEAHFPTHLFLALSQRLGISLEDPIYQSLILPHQSQLLPLPPPSPPQSPYLWLRLMSHWCRCYLGLSLSTLVTRPGELRTTPTHLDVRFSLDHSDIRIRRTGLDLNPGWVPWLGRVITFHYHGGSTYAL